MNKILLIDTETTGLSKTDEVIEISLSLYEVNIENNSTEKIAFYTGRRCPSVQINPRAQKVHKISISDLIGKDFDHEKVNSLLDNADILIAHNAAFDARMLEPIYPNIKKLHWRCTLKQWPWPTYSGKSLASIATELNISRVHAHSAEGDVNILSACLFYPEANGEYIKKLINFGDVSFKEPFDNPFKRAENIISSESQKSSKNLLDILAAIISDNHLHDSEIKFIYDWINNSPLAARAWPGNIIIDLLNQILEDGIIHEEERSNLLTILNEIINGTLKKVADKVSENPLPLDEVDAINFSDHLFCLTGNFLIGERNTCALKISNRGGLLTESITKKVDYLIIGALGSDLWKHGNYGTKIEKAIEYKSMGSSIKIIHEEVLCKYL